MFNYELYKRHTSLSPKDERGYIECVYNSNSTSTPTRLFGQKFRLYKVRKLEIDDVECGPSYNYTFSSTGDHIVKIYINNRVSKESDMFCECDRLISVKFYIHDGLPFYIGGSMFENCTNLTKIDWNNSLITIHENGYLFSGCTKLTEIDIITPVFEGTGYEYFERTFRNTHSLSKIVFPKIDRASIQETFWGLKSNNIEVDLSNIGKITNWSRPLGNASEFKKLNFGECDLSEATFDNELFLDYWYPYNSNGEIVMLGKAMNYKGWKCSSNKCLSTVRYNLEYDYSDLFFEQQKCQPIANSSVNKTLKIRFCTNDNWLTGSSHIFKINNVVGTYVGQGIYEFPIVADTYKYPIYYNNDEIGTAIVKDDIQQICFGDNPNVYKVIDFSTENSFDSSIITSNDGWTYCNDSAGYFGLCNPKINNGESTGITVNTGMIGEVYLTAAQDSQVYYHYCIISGHKTLKGYRYQSNDIRGTLTLTDGSLTFNYRKDADREGYDPINTNGNDKFYIKKLENYNWPELPE